MFGAEVSNEDMNLNGFTMNLVGVFTTSVEADVYHIKLVVLNLLVSGVFLDGLAEV